MRSISAGLRKLAYVIDDLAHQSESPYHNLPLQYTKRLELSLPSEEVQDGPPSMYNDVQKSDRLKNEEDIRRQGERPHIDYLERHTKPVTVTEFGNVREDVYGNPGIMPMHQEDRDTYSLADDQLTGNPYI